MSDVHSKAVRSYNMSRIRAKNTKPELKLRKYLFKNGFRFRIHDKKLPGTPDIVLSKYKAAIFVNGCFWHCHEGCRHFVVPKTRTEWWQKKLARNRENDTLNLQMLRNLGWRVIVVWECSLNTSKQEETMNQLVEQLKLKNVAKAD